MKKTVFVFPALVALACCAWPGLALAGEASSGAAAVLREIVDMKALTTLLIIPSLAWAGKIVRENVESFLQNRQYKKALALYGILQQAVGEIYDDIVKPYKTENPGKKLTTEVGAAAMDAAVEKVAEIAQKEGKTSLIPPLPELQLKINQVIADRKKGLFSPMFSEK